MSHQRYKRQFPIKPFHRVQFDILQLDPSVQSNRAGFKYIFGVTDVASGAIWFQGMKAKSEALSAFQAFEKWLRKVGPEIEEHTGAGVKLEVLASDRDVGFTTTFGHVRPQFDEYCRQYSREFTNAGEPRQNSRIERVWRSAMEGATTLLKESGLRAEYFFDAVQHWVHTFNSMPTDANRINPKEAPWQSLGLRCFHFDRLRPFGTMGFVKTVTGDTKVPKSGDRGKPVVLIGYATDTPGYLFIDLQAKKIDTSVHVH